MANGPSSISTGSMFGKTNENMRDQRYRSTAISNTLADAGIPSITSRLRSRTPLEEDGLEPEALIGVTFLAIFTYLLGRGAPLLYPGVGAAEIGLRRRYMTVFTLGFAVSAPVALVAPIVSFLIWGALVVLRLLFPRWVRPPPALPAMK